MLKQLALSAVVVDATPALLLAISGLYCPCSARTRVGNTRSLCPKAMRYSVLNVVVGGAHGCRWPLIVGPLVIFPCPGLLLLPEPLLWARPVVVDDGTLAIDGVSTALL